MNRNVQSPRPMVSVVMGVFNAVASLPATLRSVLEQQGCDFEFIAVDDGSTDGTGALLDEWAARDARLRVHHVPHAGLTAALIAGCAAAQGDFIARQDCGDVSLPGRLALQEAHLRSRPEVVMVAGATRFVAPEGEYLFTISRPGTQLQAGFVLEVEAIQGPPHHGATMFRRSAYEQAGGYRLPFRVAQDIDLWLRLSELGVCEGMSEICYEATMNAGGISARRRGEQVRMAGLAIDCAKARRSQSPEPPLEPENVSSTEGALRQRLRRAQYFYYLGGCLRRSDPAAAKRYYRQALREHPLMLKGLFRMLLG